jgi:hypothetical protein
MPFKYNKLRGRIIEKYGSQEKFALSVGISTVTLSRKMSGKTGFSQKDIEEWSAPDKLDIQKNEYGEYFFA